MDNLKTKILNFKPDSHPKLLAIKKVSIFEDDDDGTINDEHLHVIAKVSGMSPQNSFSKTRKA